MAPVRDYAKLAANIKDALGESNIVGASHCATRLRLILKETPADTVTKKIEQMPGVIQVVQAGGQYQIVIGMHAKDVYENLSKVMTFSGDVPEVKQGILLSTERWLDIIHLTFRHMVVILMLNLPIYQIRQPMLIAP